MQIEMTQLELRHTQLRVCDPGRLARLTASIAQEGQQSAVLVVEEGDGQYVLIDGYLRVAALSSLGEDLVEATVLPVGEDQALVMAWQMENTRRRSALEDGWFLEQLVEGHGKSQAGLATKLRRSRSWVSRRLALVRALPAEAQDAVRQGVVPAQAAMKYLVPLSRANSGHCIRLVAGLGNTAVSVRELARIYIAWRQADDEGRQRIVDHPLLFLKADEAGGTEPTADPDEADQLSNDLEGISGLCRRARRRVRDGVFSRANTPARQRASRSWKETRLAFEGLVDLMAAEVARAEPGHQVGDPAAGQ